MPEPFCFGIWVYRDERTTLDQCLAALRRSYPRSPVVIAHDGPLRAGELYLHDDYSRIADKYHCTYHTTESRTRAHPYGGFWWLRLFRFMHGAALNNRCQWYIKLDPDTRIVRPVESMPDADLCGHLRPRTDWRKGHAPQIDKFVTAAWVAIRAGLFRKFLMSDALTDAKFQDEWYGQAAHSLSGDGEGLAICSWILTDAARGLGASVVAHPEVYVRWREAVPECMWNQYAVVNVETRPSGPGRFDYVGEEVRQ